MARHKRMVEREDGWCDWVAPVMDGYMLACCDCGLVHEMQFGVFTAIDNGNGTHTLIDETVENGRVRFRARRNNRSTGQVRRHRKRAASGVSKPKG